MQRPVLRHFLLVSLLAAGNANGMTDVPADLTQLSLEDLLDIEVTSVSRRAEQLATSAAAVYVLSGEEIHQSGARSLPEALKLVPGLHVAQIDGQRWAIAARGFNGNISDKLEVLIDGRSVYSPLFSGTFWDAQDVFLPDIDRIEVIRGPASITWGSNAVNGVINIVTKRAEDTQGVLAYAGGGDEQTGFAGARYGGRAGTHAYWRAYTRYWQRDALVTTSGSDARDSMDMTQGGFRLDWASPDGDRIEFQGDIFDNTLENPTQEFLNPDGKDDSESGSNLMARWQHAIGQDSRLAVQTYWDRTKRIQRGSFGELRNTWDLQATFQTQLWQKHELVMGAGYRSSSDEQENPPLVMFTPAQRTVRSANLFINDQYRFSDVTTITLGARLEHNEFTWFDVQPSLRFSHVLSERTVLWGAVSQALRLPTRLDEDVVIASVVGNRDFQPEELLGEELGLRHLLGKNLTLDASVFYNVYDKLRGVEPGDETTPSLIVNNYNAESAGFEISSHWQPLPTLDLNAAYNYFTINFTPDSGTADVTTEATEDLAPRHQAWLRWRWSPNSRYHVGGQLRYVDKIRGQDVPAFTDLSLRLGWNITPDLEFALSGQNLLDAQHREWGEADAEAQRGVYAELVWHPAQRK